jgi:hypothetical protein
MKRSLFPVLLAGLIALGLSTGCDDDDDDAQRFTATLNGASEVPPVTTTAAGTATFEAAGETPTQISFNVQVTNLTGVTAAHIHNGPAGQNGPVVAFLCGGGGTPACGATALASGTITAGSLQAGGNISSMGQLLGTMRTGGIYVNVHTMANPGGEIRGQLQRE